MFISLHFPLWRLFKTYIRTYGLYSNILSSYLGVLKIYNTCNSEFEFIVKVLCLLKYDFFKLLLNFREKT